jgi:hypothetical protein
MAKHFRGKEKLPEKGKREKFLNQNVRKAQFESLQNYVEDRACVMVYSDFKAGISGAVHFGNDNRYLKTILEKGFS